LAFYTYDYFFIVARIYTCQNTHTLAVDEDTILVWSHAQIQKCGTAVTIVRLRVVLSSKSVFGGDFTLLSHGPTLRKWPSIWRRRTPGTRQSYIPLTVTVRCRITGPVMLELQAFGLSRTFKSACRASAAFWDTCGGRLML